MTDSTRLDTTRLRAELFFIHRALSDVAGQRGNTLDDLDGEAGSSSALIWRSLFSDCLRVVYSIAMADGEIYGFELEWIRDLLMAAAPHYTGTRDSPYGYRHPVDATSIRAFLADYAHDSGVFGYRAPVRWRGHELCRRAATGDSRESLHRYARVMRWLIAESCKISSVSQDHPRWRAVLPDIDELLQALTAAGFGPEIEVDRRVNVFLKGTRVFAPIQKAISVYEANPFDVEKLHAEARESFRKVMKQATMDSQHVATGRALLVVGGSGYGKTHLLRSFWSNVQEYGRGFVVYAQMNASVDDYTRYFLHHLVESLKLPYSGRPGGLTGLQELANAVVRLKGPAFADCANRLAELCGGPRGALDRQINQLVDELLGHVALGGADPDLLRVLLYSLCRDPKTTSRVYQYLCCDDMNDHDRGLIGNLVPRTAREDRAAMIRKLAHLAFVSRGATLVLMLDQVELSGVDSVQAMSTFQRAVDALLGIESQVRSVVVVIACLSDLLDMALKEMSRPTLDRLIKDPPPARLSERLSYDEIQAIVGQRLAWMFAEADAVYRAADPVYPVPEAELRDRVGLRVRDILDWCQQFHERCVEARKILSAEPEPEPPPPIERIAQAWRAALAKVRDPASLRDDEVLALVAIAVQAYTAETGVSLVRSHQDNLLRLRRPGAPEATDLMIGVTSRGPQAGSFGKQIHKLRKVAGNAIAVAVRADSFPSGARSTEAIAEFVAAGGRAIHLDKQTLRALVAYQAFQPAFSDEHVQAWKRSNRPISSLPDIAAMLGIEPSRSESRPFAGNDAVPRASGDRSPDTTTSASAAAAAC